MKKKLFAFFVLIFGICGTLSYISFQQENKVEATSSSASVWDGKYYDESELTHDDIEINASEYRIKSAKGLAFIVQEVNKSGSYKSFNGVTIVLDVDIDLAGKPWVPIGTYQNSKQSFKGVFDGNGHYIYNLNISQDADGNFEKGGDYSGLLAAKNIGFFGTVARGQSNVGTHIKNLHFRNVEISITKPADDMNIGTIVGNLVGNPMNVNTKTSFVYNCSVDGKIEIGGLNANKLNVGGVIGRTEMAQIGSVGHTIETGVHSCVDINFSGENTVASNLKVGGVVGSQTKTALYNSAFEGNIDLNSLNAGEDPDAYVGGIVGYLCSNAGSSTNALIKNSYNIGNIKNVGTNSVIGGVAGFVDGYDAGDGYVSYFDIENVYNAGKNLDNNKTIDSIIGDISSPDEDYSILKDSMQLNIDAAATQNDILITQKLSDISAENVYYYSVIENLSDKNVGGKKDLFKLAKSKGFYSCSSNNEEDEWPQTECWTKNSWDFENVWQISPSLNGGLPYIHIDGINNDKDYSSGESKLRGVGTANDPYMIETPADLAWLSMNWTQNYDDGAIYYPYQGKYFSLQNDIDLTGKTWVPIAYGSDEYFSGVFDGNGYTIFGMNCSLQQQFEYHALISKTKNAVIKNLKIEDVRFANDGTGSESSTINRAAIVGRAEQNSYLINICDNSGIEDLKTVANASGLNVFYGQLNSGISKSNLCLDGLTYNEGYEIEIDGAGGVFYDSDKNVYSEYHVLVDEDFKFFDVSDFDSTFAKNLLPTTSNVENVSLNEQDLLIRRGYLLAGFLDAAGTLYDEYNEGTQKFDVENFDANAVAGLEAQWFVPDSKIKIVYNAYEDNFFKPEPEGYYSKEISVAYDSYLSDYLDELMNYSDTDNELRSGFEVVGIYGSFDEALGEANCFQNLICDDSGLTEDLRLNSLVLDGNYEIVYYAKWKGSEDERRSLTINFNKTEQEFFKNFLYEDAIESVELVGYDANDLTHTFSKTIPSEEILSLIEVSDGVESLTLSLDFDTSFSDRKNNWYTLNINLKDGYILTHDIHWTSGTEVSGVDNYGVYTTAINADFGGLVENTTVIPHPVEYLLTNEINRSIPTTSFDLLNLSGDYVLNLTLSRKQFEKGLYISGSHYYGISPVVDEFEHFEVYYEAFDAWGNIGQDYVNSEYFAYNILEGYILGSNNFYDIKTGIAPSGNRFAVRYRLSESNYEYYYYELTTFKVEGQYYYEISLYKANASAGSTPDKLNAVEKVLSVVGMCNYDEKAGVITSYSHPSTLYYLADSSFAFVYSTENDSSSFYKMNPVGESDSELGKFNYFKLKSYFETDEAEKEVERVSKYMHVFKDFVDFTSSESDSLIEYSEKYSSTNRTKIQSVSQYTKAYFEFEYYTKDVDNNLIKLEENAPTPIESVDSEVGADVSAISVVLNITSSNYFKFAGESAVLYDGENADVYNIKIEWDPDTLESDNDDIKNNYTVNLNNSNYFEADSEKYYKGQFFENASGDEIKASDDGYKVTLRYNTGSNKLLPGAYKIKIVCEDVLYSLNTYTKFLDAEDYLSLDFKQEEAHLIDTSSTKTENIKYADEITLDTALTDNEGYVFYGWYLVQNSANPLNRYIAYENGLINKDSEITVPYFDLNDQTNQDQMIGQGNNVEYSDSLNRRHIDAHAIYLKKQVTLNLLGQNNGQIMYALVNREQPYDSALFDKRTQPTQTIKTDIEMYVEEVSGKQSSLTYKYSSNADAEKLPKISFKLSGQNSAAYDIFGVALINEYGYIVEDANGNEIIIYSNKVENADGTYSYEQDFDLHEILKAKIEAGETDLEQTYRIMPLLKQKEINIVFHSGTGDSTNEYGDQLNGEVFSKGVEDAIENNTTFVVENVIINSRIYTDAESNGKLNGEEKSLILNNLFYSRKGYANDPYGYRWVVDGQKEDSSVAIDIGLFENSDASILADGGFVHVYRIWNARTYTISFNLVGGAWSGFGTESIDQVYDKTVEAEIPTNVVKVGYNFVGWSFEGQTIFDKDGNLVKGTNLYDSDGLYKYAANAQLRAIWQEKTYEIKIEFNGANSIYLGEDLQEEIFREEQLSYSKNYSILYNSTFGNLYESSDLIKIEDIIPKRVGFEFDGFYIIKGTQRVKVSNSTLFNQYLLSFVDTTSQESVTLCAYWNFVPSSLNITLNDNLLSKEYNGQLQTIKISDYFFEDNYSATNFVVGVEDGVLTIELNENVNAQCQMIFESLSATAIYPDDLAFAVKEAGNYQSKLMVYVLDKAKSLVGSQLWSKEINFYVTVEKVDLTVVEAGVQIVENARRIMEPFFEEGTLDELQTIKQEMRNVFGLANNIDLTDMQALAYMSDNLITLSLTDTELYEFLMTKYYLLLYTNDADLHNVYRVWRYMDYLEYLKTNSNEEILKKLKYFDFYDYAGTNFESEYNAVLKDISSIYNPEVSFVVSGLGAEEIKPSKIKIFAAVDISANNTYELRVYLADKVFGTNAAQNFNVSYDSESNPYLVVGQIYILPQVLDVENLGEDMSYYQIGSSAEIIEWYTGRESIRYNTQTLYNLESDIYLKADLVTSNAGRVDENTEFSFFDYETSNWLYFDNVLLLRKIDEYYMDVSNMFKLRAPDIYTILSTSGVAEILVSGKKLTREGNVSMFADISQSNFIISSIEYTLDGVSYIKTDVDLSKTSVFEAENENGLLEVIYEIRENENGEHILFVNSHVVRVVFATPNKYLDTNRYVGLYKWSSVLEYSLTGQMADDNSIVFDFDFAADGKSFEAFVSTGGNRLENIDSSLEGVTQIGYYGIFTDLVVVNYEYNMPGEDYEKKSAILKLGSDTFDNLNLPNVRGFEIASLTEETSQLDILKEENRSVMFNGAGSTFSGIDAEHPHKRIKLIAKWNLVEIEYNQLTTGSVFPVKSFTNIDYSNVVNILNRNDDIFEYSFAWQYRKTASDAWTKPNSNTSGNSDRLVSEKLMLNGNGSRDESGMYKLIVVATLQSAYEVALANMTTNYVSIEVVFSLEFMRIEILEVLSEYTSSTYNSLDKINGLNAQVRLKAYGGTENVLTAYYSEMGTELTFVVTKNAQKVKTVKNVGTYNVKLVFDENYYNISALAEGDDSFEFEVLPYQFDLSSYIESETFSFSKMFNAQDVALNMSARTTYDTVGFEFSRESGENIGTYDLYLKDVTTENKNNYIFVVGDTVIFENGLPTEDASSTRVGKFNITAATKLILSYETSEENPQTISMPYADNGYSLTAEDQLLKILDAVNGNVLKTLALKLYDPVAQEYLADEVLGYVVDKIDTLTFGFYSGQSYNIAKETLTYIYKVGNSLEFDDYYQEVVFDDAFKFVVDKIEIDVSSFEFVKVFDASAYQDFDLSGNVIDLNSYSGVYVRATYSSIHAADDLAVSLVLLKTQDSSDALSKYELKATSSIGKINKIAAQLNFNMAKAQYTYGEVRVDDLASVFDSPNLSIVAGGEDVTDWLFEGYYSLNYSIEDATQIRNGNVCVGTHEISVSYNFVDFEMTVSNPTVTIVALQVLKSIQPAYISITNVEPVSLPFEETIMISTGEFVDLELYPQNIVLDAQNRPSSGSYDLTFDNGAISAEFLGGNVVVTLTESNLGLQVVDSTIALFVEIELEDILSQEYCGSAFEITIENSILNIANAGSSNLKFYEYSGENLVEVAVEFSTLEITTAESSTTISKSVGKTELVLNATDSESKYEVVFKKQYVFEVVAKTIDVDALGNLDKQYDGERYETFEISVADGKIEGDDVSIRAVFATDSIRENCDVSLYLQGNDRFNYKLSKSSIMANITKADATVELAKTTYEYGEIRNTTQLEAKVLSNGKEVYSGFYRLKFDIAKAGDLEEAEYSNGYLVVGNYSVSLASSSTSDNYNLSFAGAEIVVEKYSLDVIFEEAGGLKIAFDDPLSSSATLDYDYTTPLNETVEICITRQANENGKFDEMGDYFVISATTEDANYEIASVEDNAGFVRILKAKDIVYLLASDEETILSENLNGLELQIEYDAFAYDTVSIESRENGWNLVISSSEHVTNRKTFALNAYTLADTTYTKVDAKIENLSGTIYLTETATNASEYSYKILAYDAYSDNYDVRFGKNGESYAYHLYITKKQVYFKEGEVNDVKVVVGEINNIPYMSKQFNNQYAEFSIDDASGILTGLSDDGILQNQQLGLDIKFVDASGNLAKYVGEGYYYLAAELSGEFKDNYQLNLKLLNAAKEENPNGMRSYIDSAPLTFVASSKSYNYGDLFKDENNAIELDWFSYTTEFDMTGYDFSRMSTMKLYIDGPLFSSSGALEAGEYSTYFVFPCRDFYLKYLINGLEANNLEDLRVKINKKSLEISQKGSVTLEEVFTKVYDGDTTVDIFDGDDNLRFNLDGVISGDDVKIDRANYSRPEIGDANEISFEISGADFENYNLNSYVYGVIEPVVVSLVFNYDRSTITSDTTEIYNLVEISQLNYPFLSGASLTSNSSVASTSWTNNFPNRLFKTGFNFSHWSMKFDIADDAEKKTFLENSTKGMTTSFDNGIFEVTVGNNEKTVSLLKALIGEDDTNMFGLYYKENLNPEIVFEPNYTTQSWPLSVEIVDENGHISERGEVIICINDDAENQQIVTNKTILSIDYGSKVVVTAEAKEHYYFAGFKIDGNAESNNVYTIDSFVNGMNIRATFIVQKVDLVYDLTGYDASEISMPSQFVSNKYSSDFETLKDVTLESILLSREGYSVYALDVKVGNVTQTVSRDDFATTKIGDLIADRFESLVTVEIKPIFKAQDVKVVLDYGYDSKQEEIYVEYRNTYAAASGWVENPSREGYDFAGWWTVNGEIGGNWGTQIVGETILNSISDHTLYAKWSILSFSLKLSAEFATLSNANIDFVANANVWTADSVEFGFVVEFVLTPDAGYMIESEGWADEFEVVLNVDKTANIVLTMPSRDVDFVMPTKPESNKVTITGSNLQRLSYKVDSQVNNELNGSQFSIDFDVETAKTVIIEFSSSKGYYVEDVEISDQTLTVEKNLDVDGHVVGLVLNGIYQDVVVTINAVERQNKLTIVFDDYSVVENIQTSAGEEIVDFEESIEYFARTGEMLVFYLKYKLGFVFDTCSSEQYTLEIVEASGVYEGFAQLTISDIAEDGTVYLTSTKASYKIVGKSISYEHDGQENPDAQNIVYINGSVDDVEVKIGDSVNLSFNLVDTTFDFAGWSVDGRTTFSSVSPFVYTITEEDLSRLNENGKIVIYGIFSKLKYNITFATYSFYTVGKEYEDTTKLKDIYKEVLAQYLDDEGNSITKTTILYGVNKIVKFVVPRGYKYLGFGYFKNDEFISLESKETDESSVDATILSRKVEDGMQICFLIKPLSINISIKNYINYDGFIEEDKDVGSTCLFGANDSFELNRYGVIEGTNVRIASDYFEDGEVLSDKQFDIVANSGDEVYIKVKTVKAGYKFQTISSTKGDLSILEVEKTDEHTVFKIFNIVAIYDAEIQVLFKPQLNIIDLSFKHNEMQTDGGAFVLNISDENKKKIFTSGKEYSAITVSAYTDTEFVVSAFVRAGFYVDPNNLQAHIFDENGIIVEGTLSYDLLSVVETGYVGRINFKVADYLGAFKIDILLDNLTYTVNLKDQDAVLATIRNVEFDELLNIAESNQNNIEVFDDRFSFVNGRLNTILTLEKHNFEGYFTGQNGSGIQYINSLGDAVNYWNESGYVFDELTSKYVLSDNATLNLETGEMIIDLYLYMSYLKTRISFEILPSVNQEITAQDMITGIDYTNSWFYATSPMYIEVSYNTDIYFHAPEFEGYTFYKFVISQRNANGEWLTDVVSTSNDVPWSTNEFAQIVECKVQIVYYAQIDVKIIGGDAKVSIIQAGTPKDMLDNFFVDTSKDFEIVAVPDEGYDFVMWKNLNTNKETHTAKLKTSTKNKLSLALYLQGKTTRLNFVDYDPTFGQIWSMKVDSRDGASKTVTLGGMSGSKFIKTVFETSATDAREQIRVGDKITFTVSIDYGFAAFWNRNDIMLNSYYEGYYYFEMTIPADCAGQVIKIIPTFTDEVMSFYVESKFDVVSDNAIDLNFVDLAGSVVFGNQKVKQFVSPKGQEVRASVVANDRYAVSKVTIENYGRQFINMAEFMPEDNTIVLTPEYLNEKSIVGNIKIVVEYTRKLWADMTIDNMLDGEGTARNSYKIKSAEDFALAMQLINSGAQNSDGLKYKDAHYLLQADIDLGEMFWTPIGTYENAFNGEFDLSTFKVSGVYLAYFYTPISYGGLFGVLGPNANIHESNPDMWYIYLIVGIVAAMITILVVLIVYNKKKKKRRQELAHK